MREAYRLNYKKIFELFVNQNSKQLKLFIIYVGKEMVDYGIIEKSMVIVLEKVGQFENRVGAIKPQDSI
jgi:hypothetical protein